MKNIAVEIFLSAVESVKPENLMHAQMKATDNRLTIGDDSFLLNIFEHIYLLAAGKAAALMAKEAEMILGDRISDGHAVTKYGHTTQLKRISITEAGHPIPDIEGVEGTRKLVEIAKRATEKDLVVFLVSGGASALMADLPDGIALEDLKLTNELLVKSGADISEINTVRKHLSNIKGGHFAGITYPATILTLILSDAVGDRLEVIASGPTVPDTTTFADAMAIINKYDLQNLLPKNILNHIQTGIEGLTPETPKQDDPIFENVYNHIIGSNQTALQAASEKAKELGFNTQIITDSLQGDYKTVADFILEEIEKKRNSATQKPLCLLFGGEPTVKVTDNGLGGRNQHLALYFATKIQNRKDTTILCAGTDGTDGPTDAAGAVVNHNTVADALKSNIAVNKYLSEFDSFHFFEKAGGWIKTGNTGTNVMDVVVVLME